MKNQIFLFLVCTLFQIAASAQQDNAGDLQRKLSNHLANNFQEKIYIHNDKDAYLAGEIIWFKVYCTEAYTNLPSNMSKVAYVELLNSENKPVIQTKIELKDGRGAGSAYLPVALESGSYSLRSYTSWMQNFNPDFYYKKNLSIYNTVRDEQVAVNTSEKMPALQFFPEGGNLVSGLISKVAFKVSDSEGHPVDFKGAILDGTDTIVRFAPSKFGIGSFTFRPERQRSYKAVVLPARGKPFSSPLPPIYDNGVVMTVNSETSALNIGLQNNMQNNDKFTLLVHTGHKVGFIRTLSSGQFSDGFTVPFTDLGDGISHLTLFDGAGRPMCERLFFKKPDKILEINISADKAVYSPRERATVSFSQISNGEPVSGDFSVTVYKADSVKRSDGDISSVLWLTSELKGNVKDAGWYFNNPSHDSMDELMLTHGWRRFKWDDVLSEKKADYKHIPELQGHVVSGRIVNADNQKPVANQAAFLSIPNRRSQFYTGLSNANGLVNFYTKDFRGASEVNFQTDSRNDSLVRLEIISPFSTYTAHSAKPSLTKYPNKQELLDRSVAMQVNNIYQSKNLNREKLEPIDSAAFYVKPDKVYKLDDFVRFTTMEEVLREYVPEVSVGLKNKSFQLRMLSPAIGTFHNKAPLILVDGVPVFDEGNTVMQVNPMHIQRLELVNDAYVYGHSVFSGILSLHSYKGDLGGFKLPQQAAVLDYDGLQNVREFYSPMYPEDTNSRIPDYRTTLFWSPNTKADKDGKAILELFTSDLDGKYQIVVQSLSADGATGSKAAQFDVLKKGN